MQSQTNVTFLADMHKSSVTAARLRRIDADLGNYSPNSVTFYDEFLARMQKLPRYRDITKIDSDQLHSLVNESVTPTQAPHSYKKYLAMVSLLRHAKELGATCELLPFDIAELSNLDNLFAVTCDEVERRVLAGSPSGNAVLSFLNMVNHLMLAKKREEQLAPILEGKLKSLRELEGRHNVYLLLGGGHVPPLAEVATKYSSSVETFGHMYLVGPTNRLLQNAFELAGTIHLDGRDLPSILNGSHQIDLGALFGFIVKVSAGVLMSAPHSAVEKMMEMEREYELLNNGIIPESLKASGGS